jgi:hypothetical protein
MANTTLNVDDMKAKLQGGGARPNLFFVQLGFPASLGITSPGSDEDVSFMVKMASLPGSTVANIEVPFRGRKLMVAGDRTFDPWSVTIINDNDFKIRNSFEQWMNAINDHVTNTGAIKPADYMAEMRVTQLNKKGEPQREYVIHNAFPTALGAIELDYGAESTIEEFSVEFQIMHWTSAGATGNDGGTDIAGLLGNTSIGQMLSGLAGLNNL